MISHLYVESEKVKFIEAERRMVVTRDWGQGREDGRAVNQCMRYLS
jgi:hypothetical protein